MKSIEELATDLILLIESAPERDYWIREQIPYVALKEALAVPPAAPEGFPKWFIWDNRCLLCYTCPDLGRWHDIKSGDSWPATFTLEQNRKDCLDSGFMKPITEIEAKQILTSKKVS